MNDRLPARNSDNAFHINQANLNKRMKKWYNNVNSNLDTVIVNDYEIDMVTKKYADKEIIDDILSNPPLEKFIIRENLNSEVAKKTGVIGYEIIVSNEIILFHNVTGERFIPHFELAVRIINNSSYHANNLYIPVSISKDKTTDFYSHSCLVTEDFIIMVSSITGTFELMPYDDVKFTNDVSFLAFNTLLAVLYIIKNKPSILVERVSRVKLSNGNNAHKKKSKRPTKTKIRKIITIDSRNADNEISEKNKPSKESVKRKHNITCESWGVMGHWREYKSGKRVWIKPYRKGKKRDNPSAEYKAKNYIPPNS